MKRAIVVFLIVAGIGVGAGAYYMRRSTGEFTVNTAPVSRGDIIDTVSATGALQAVTTVQVGSQVSGNISWLGADFNSIVRKGQVIARIDPSIFQAQVDQSRANLMRSRADLAKSSAEVERNKVALIDTQQKYARTKELAARSLLPQSDLDAAQIAVDSAKAQLQSSQAALQSSQAAIEQAQASLNQNAVNLQHCTIVAPIDGIVTSRNVDVGQTVAASFQSPTLFILAADLTKMQVIANIDEADVGRIRPRQHVTFRVDAYPAEEFTGTVSQVRLQPIVVQNVTTYSTVVDVPNTELKLKPGMTANLKVQIAHRSDVLRVPNTALRFRPTAEAFAALGQAAPSEQPFGAQGRQTAAASSDEPVRSGDRAPIGTGAPPATGAPAAAARQGPGMDSSTDGPTVTRGGPIGRGDRSASDLSSEGAAANSGDRRARMLERFKSMSPEERQQSLERMKARGLDVPGLEGGRAAKSQTSPGKDAPQAAETIDALFGPLPPVESVGRVWLFANRELKPVRLRLGITDGTNTEILSEELQAGTEVVTGVILNGTPRTTSASGNPLMPQRGGPGGRPPGR